MLMLSIDTDGDFIISHPKQGELKSNMRIISDDPDDIIDFLGECTVRDINYRSRFFDAIKIMRKKIKLYKRGDVQDGNFSMECEEVYPIFLHRKLV